MAGSDGGARGDPRRHGDTGGARVPRQTLTPKDLGARPEPGRPEPKRAAAPAPGRRPPATAVKRGGRRRPAPAAAQQQLMARISASRRARQRRALLIVSCLMSALVLLAAGSAWVLTSYINSHLGRLDAGTGGTPASGPLNILLAGLDERTGLTRHQQLILHVGGSTGETNTDTLMVVHVPADHRYVQVVSLPRDSWVNIPGHGMNKINAALGLGGPKLMVRTVEQLTGLDINDYVEVNFLGFVKVIDALGGVNICLPYAVDDPYSGLQMSAGMHHVNGITALEFARDRHSFPTSDLARIQDQQQLIATALSQGISSGMLVNPVRLASFLSAASAAIKVDQGFNAGRVAGELRGITAGDVTFTTVPLSNLNYSTPGGQSAVLWDTQAAGALFHQLKTDQPPVRLVPARPVRQQAKPGLRPGQVSLAVYNGTQIAGLSAETADQLSGLGFRISLAGVDWPAQNVAKTAIQYPGGDREAANLVRQALPGASLQQVAGIPGVRIVLGAAGHTVARPAPGTRSQPSPPAQQKTAVQAACH